jgi:hypothetical protein
VAETGDPARIAVTPVASRLNIVEQLVQLNTSREDADASWLGSRMQPAVGHILDAERIVLKR